MVIIFDNFHVGYDDSGPNKPFLLKKTIASPYWKSFEKIIYTNF